MKQFLSANFTSLWFHVIINVYIKQQQKVVLPSDKLFGFRVVFIHSIKFNYIVNLKKLSLNCVWEPLQNYTFTDCFFFVPFLLVIRVLNQLFYNFKASSQSNRFDETPYRQIGSVMRFQNIINVKANRNYYLKFHLHLIYSVSRRCNANCLSQTTNLVWFLRS